MLRGEGNQYRYLIVTSLNEFPKEYIKELMADAYANSLAKVKDPKQLLKGLTITKSISSKKRPAKKVKSKLKLKPVVKKKIKRY